MMDDDGRNIQRLTDDGWWPVWSPDGKQIAFSKKPPGAPNWPQISAIYIINSDGADEYRLTDEDTFEDYPTWSPDGKYIAFSSNRLAKLGVAQRDIWRINLETKALRRLTRIDGKVAMSPSWSPDGTYIVYWQEGAGGFNLMDANGGRRRQLGFGGGRPRWSPDSQSIVFNSFQGFRKNFLYVMNSGGEDLRQLIEVAAGGASWSPDGKQVLFSTTRDDADGEDTFDLFVTDLNGQEPRQLTDKPKWELNPAWSPDSRWVTFDAREPRQNATSAIYVMNAADAELRQLTDELSLNWGPAWVPVRRAFPVQPSAVLLTTLWGRLKQE